VHAKELMHGKASEVEIDRECLIFRNLPEKIRVGRYHSLIVQKEGLPECLKITAVTQDGEIMGLMHKSFPVFGIQFHPESILYSGRKGNLKKFH